MDTVTLFSQHLRLLGQEESTIKTNLKLIRKILQDCSPLRKESINVMIEGLILSKKSKSYIRQHVTVIRIYASWAKIDDLIGYPYPKIKNKSTFIKGTLSDEEIEAFLQLSYECDRKGKFRQRGTYTYEERWNMFSIFWYIEAYTGMRPIEVCGLTVNDVDFGMNEFLLRHTKTHMPRTIPISFVIKETIGRYVKEINSEYLFPSLHNPNVPITPSAALQHFKKRIMRLGIKRANLTPYSFRHSFASRIIDETSIYKVKTLMGHTKITTTEKYLHTNKKALQKMIDNDPLAERYFSPQQMLKEIGKALHILKDKYGEFLDIGVSEDNEEVRLFGKLLKKQML